MKQCVTYVAFLNSIFLLIACQDSDMLNLHDEIPWLVGKWQNVQSQDNYEEWAAINKHHFRGINYRVDSTGAYHIRETIELKSTKEGLVYRPKIEGTKETAAVDFFLKTKGEQFLVFENADHDFPQIISYEQLDARRMKAIIKGQKDQNFRKVEFDFRKIDE